MNKNPLVNYAHEVSRLTYSNTVDTIDGKFGSGYALRNPSAVATLLRFQEELIRSTSNLILDGKLTVEEIVEFVNSKKQ